MCVGFVREKRKKIIFCYICMFWGGQCCLILIGGAGSYLPAHNIHNKKNSMIDRTLSTPNKVFDVCL